MLSVFCTAPLNLKFYGAIEIIDILLLLLSATDVCRTLPDSDSGGVVQADVDGDADPAAAVCCSRGQD